MKEKSNKIKDIVLIAILSVIIFVQKELLNIIPNVSLTIFLLCLYTKKLGFIKSFIILIIYVLLDNMYMASFNIVYTPFMFLGFLFTLIIYRVFLYSNSNPVYMALLSIIPSLLYVFIYIIPSALIYKIDLIAYLIADIPFDIIFVVSNFTIILLLYKPISNVFNSFYSNYKGA